jgi:hypothetical protein
MPTEIAIITGIARYEFKMLWRRRALVVLMLSMALILVASPLLSSDLDAIANLANVEEDNVDLALSLTVALATWLPMAVMLVFILPVVMADTIPLDRQYHVDELLNTTRITPATYLAGKLLGVWTATLAGLAAIMLIVTAVWVVQVGDFDFDMYLEIWLVNATSITILNGSLGVLLAVGQPNRRRAVLVVIGLFMVLIFVLGFDFGAMWSLGSPVRTPMMTYFIPTEDTSTLVTTVFNRDVLLTIFIGFVQLLAIWLIAWGWLKYQQDHT